MTKNETKKQKVKFVQKEPVQYRSKQTVNAILNACSELLIEIGFYNLTTDKIAQKANISIGSLYQFFGNKESVVAAVIQRLLEEDFNYFDSQVKNIHNLPAQERAKGLIKIGIDIFKNNSVLRSKIQSVRLYLTDTSYNQALMKKYQDYVAQIIQPKNGVAKETTAYIVVHAFLGVMQNVSIDNIDLESRTDLIEEINRIFHPLLT